MINSMTAYGRAQERSAGKNITVELKSVNSRYFDCAIKVPKLYGFLEEKLKAYVQSKGVVRGKVEIYVGIEIVESLGIKIELDSAYAESYIAALKRLRDDFGLQDDISTMSVARNQDIFNVTKPDEDMEALWNEIAPVADEAIGAFLAMRASEGERLKKDISAKKEHISELAAKIEERSESAVAAYRERLLQKLRQTVAGFDPIADEARILTECAIFADRVAIDEELVRLRSHFKAFDEILESGEPVGRKLDFLLQEMNRETNTIGSKCLDADIAHIVVDIKCELEKIREQIQNLE